MKVHDMRKHYVTRDGGLTWAPKVPFDSAEHAIDSGFPLSLWIPYECDECGKYHVGKRRKNDKVS